jgi:nucleotide-binding universal stress UspA family protein
MNSVRQPVVVVGVNGSGASAAALRWAAAEARRRHAALRVVRSWDAEVHAPYACADAQATPAQQLAAASEDLADVLRLAFGPELPAEISAELVRGAAERVLISQSAEADLLVLGSPAPPALAGRPVGSVIRACLHHAQCPVVVVGAPVRADVAGPQPPAQTAAASPARRRELVST